MTITAHCGESLPYLKCQMAEYLPRLEAANGFVARSALTAIKVLEAADPVSEEFSQALADLHVTATILGPYSEGMVEAIDQFTEDLPDEEEG